ncbi:MAG: branched-chain amino acid ABC transporter substrate-binding protein [Phycisphaerae bacterium]|nr:branched-chain amino acid ABC transporter substrate-binding protein [Phycisphaerae bacterium]
MRLSKSPAARPTVRLVTLGSLVTLVVGLSAAFATSFGAAAAPPEAAASKGTLRIVSSLPRTGSANAQTTTMVNGIKMAIDEVGAKIDGYDILYDDWDDASPQRGNWDPQIEAQNANRAVKDKEIVGYIGTFNSGASKISMPVLNKDGLVMVSPANTYPGLTKPGFGEKNEPKVYRPSGKINYFRVVPTDDLQGAVAADWTKEILAKNDPTAKKVFILHDRELYGKGIADVFQKRSKEIGLEVVGYEGIDPKAANYKSLVTKIKQTGAQLVYFGGTTQNNAGQIAKDLRAGGVDAPMMVPDGCFETAFIDAAGAENLNGKTYITFGGLPADKLTGKGAEFRASYLKRYGAEPEAYAVYGYEAARVLLDAIDRAPTKDRAAILAAVAATKNFVGALGTWSFDENGDTTNKVMSGQSVEDGKFKFVKVLGN